MGKEDLKLAKEVNWLYDRLTKKEFNILMKWVSANCDTSRQNLLDDIKYICEENCYCDTQDGTFFSKTPTSKQICCFCFVLEELKKKYGLR